MGVSAYSGSTPFPFSHTSESARKYGRRFSTPAEKRAGAFLPGTTLEDSLCARGGSRTRTSVKTGDFKSPTATNYVTRANGCMTSIPVRRWSVLLAPRFVYDYMKPEWRRRPGSNRRIAVLQTAALTNFATTPLQEQY